MVFEIKKLFDGVKYLPDVVDTPLWAFIDPDKISQTKKSDRQVARLYQAIADRENYFQDNTPTAFGNPDYSRLCGVVDGILMAMEAYEAEVDGMIVVRIERTGKKILVVDKVKRHESYYEAEQENRELRKAFGFGGLF